MKNLPALVTLLVVGWGVHGFERCAVAGEIGYVEEFALAQDRSIALKQLIPGTEDFYYYHCLHYQNSEQYDRVEQLLPTWIERYGYTPRVHEIQNRQALLTYRLHPEKSLDYLRRTLQLNFDQQRETVGASPDLPAQLDPSLIARETLVQRAMRDYQNLDGFEDAAFDFLVQTKLPPERLRNLLQRLQRPDYPGLAQLVVDDLNFQGSGGFGSLPIHSLLLLDQLDECLRLKPDLLNQGQFINAYLSKLRPNDDVDLQRDVAAKQAYLDRLWSFVERLAPAHNSLKAHVLYHRLLLDRERGVYDRPRFMTYIELPRAVGYINAKYLEQTSTGGFTADLNSDFRATTLMPPVVDDEPLVRSYLQHFFLTETTYKPYASYIDDTYLKHLFAETKIVHGLGDAEQWSALLPPEAFQALKQRVDLDFAYSNRQYFAGDEPIRIDLSVKNVPTLIVKVYEINTFNYFRENDRDVNTDVNLDGLVANHEETYQYDDPPLRRVMRHFEFPSLTESGTYVIDFIGNGKSSRAVISKGQLQYLVRTSAAGHVFTVLNEKNDKLTDASLWLAGHEYTAGEDGTIVVPYSTNPGRQAIVLRHGTLATIDSFEHAGEVYQLAAGIYVDRESLLARKKAKVLVRPALLLDGTRVTLSLLHDVRFVITSTDLDGVSSTKEISDFPLYEDRESVYEFQVPQRLANIQFALTAQVRNISQNKKVDLSATNSFQLNGIDKTDKIKDLHLMTAGGNFVLELLGKTGEGEADQPVHFAIKHHDFKTPAEVILRTDERGQIQLGALADIDSLTATGPAEITRTWTMHHDQHSRHGTLHAQEGTKLSIPYMGQAAEPQRDEMSLLELRGNTFIADRFDALSLSGGMLVVSGLPRGDYELWLKRSNQKIRLLIAAGKTAEGYVLGEHRQLELFPDKPLQIKEIAVRDGQLSIQLVNADRFARVHIFATRYEPAYGAYNCLGSIQDREPTVVLRSIHDSMYASGRKLGDEYRYIIDRKYLKKYPGNMLERPSLLLNPWAVRKTETATQQAAQGQEFAAETPAPPSSRAEAEHAGAMAAEKTDSPNLDFLAVGSAVLTNLVPGEQGVVSVDAAKLKAYQRVWVVAVHPLQTVSRKLSLPEAERQFLDLRLEQGLDPAKHFTQQKRISIVQADKTFTLPDISTARFEDYDSLTKAYRLMMTLNRDPKLSEFGFTMNWDQLKPEEKREKYSKYACHELSFFLYHKDRPFFDQVILPYLKNKKDKTFLDHWLVGDDLQHYLEPWAYGQLNTAERVLLAERIPDELVHMRRLIGDEFALLPPNTDRFNFLFNTAIQGSALQADDKLSESFFKRQSDLTRERSLGIPGRAGGMRDAAERPQSMAAKGTSDAVAADAARELKEKQGVESLSRRARAAVRLADQKKLAQDADKAFEYFGNDRGVRKDVRRFYQQMDKTQEWAEDNYYHLRIEQQNADLISVNGFWRDFANRDPNQKFLSINLAEATSDFPEMMLALSVLDLPFRSPEHEVKLEQAAMTLVASQPMVVFHEEIRPAEPVSAETPILVSQNFFRHGDRYRFVDNQKLDKYVTDEFLVQAVYGCQVVVTNPTSAPQKLDLLLQVPVGAIPVLNGKETRSVHTDLEPFHTATFEYYFYFPLPGDFAHYPVHVSKNEQLLAFAPPVQLQVVKQLTKIDRQSWQYVSQNGTNEEVLAYLKKENLQRIELAKIAFRMQNKGFFREVIELLTAAHVYNPTLWSYSIKHDAPEAIQVFLEHRDDFVSQCGLVLDSPLLKIDPVERKSYQHLDYRPLVNARSHQLGEHRQIVNDRLLQQYHSLLSLLCYERQLDDDELMAVTYYMLLQDRIEDALGYYSRVNPDQLATRLQYDYFTAYLDFYMEKPELAGPIAARYADYPVDRWRDAFQSISQQLQEIQGKSTTAVDAENRQQSQTQLAATEPGFDFQVEAKKVRVNYQNLARVRVNYYLMDIELLFSRNPFVQQYSGQFSTIRPNLSASVDLPSDQSTFQFDLPEQLRNSNVLVEIVGAGITRSQAYYANSLDVQVVENYGQLRVGDQASGRPLSKVYVKVYGRMEDGAVQFYKDGYTDLRGRFDYTSLNTNELDSVKKFALLILSDEHGAVVREADPPKR